MPESNPLLTQRRARYRVRTVTTCEWSWGTPASAVWEKKNFCTWGNEHSRECDGIEHSRIVRIGHWRYAFLLRLLVSLRSSLNSHQLSSCAASSINVKHPYHFGDGVAILAVWLKKLMPRQTRPRSLVTVRRHIRDGSLFLGECSHGVPWKNWCQKQGLDVAIVNEIENRIGVLNSQIQRHRSESTA